ncbi:unnamed protein product [Sphagnum troendelagicum]|uniref:Uncharacterized protein n=1 Tax=Sphagnum troendelagicum TaxID=128251 RepID=A0ABP0U173_9BRYO
MAGEAELDGTLELVTAARWGSETQVGNALEKIRIASEKIESEKGPIAAEKSRIASKNYKETAGYGYTPLHTAVFKNTRVAWVLIQDKEVDLDAKTGLGQTALHSGWPQCVDAMLLSRRSVKWDEPDEIGQTPLLYHARLVNDVCLKAVLKLTLDNLVNIKETTKDGFTMEIAGVHRTPETSTSQSAAPPPETSTSQSAAPPPETSTSESAPPPPDTAEPATARKGCSQLFDCLIPRAKKDTNTNESATNHENDSQDHPEASQPPEGERSTHPNTDAVTDIIEAELQSEVANFVNQKDNIGRTALHYIAEDGCVKILDKLLNWFTVEKARSEVDVNVKDYYGFAPLHLAVRKGHTQMVERLLNEPKTDAGVTVGPLRRPETGRSGWKEEHLEMCRPNLEMCRPNLSSKAPKGKIPIVGLTALHFAAIGGHTKIADLLVNWKRVTKQGDQSKTTTVVVTAEDTKNLPSPFTFSIYNKHLDVATLLLRHITKDPHHEVFKRVLALALGEQEIDCDRVVKVFNKSEQDGDLSKTFERLLIVAANENLPDVIRNIFNWQPEVDVNFQAKWEDKRNSSTSLHFAVLRGHVDIVRQLLSQKSLDVNAEDSKERTPLQIAVEGDRSRHAKDGDKIQRKQIKKLLMERAEVKDLVERLYRDREVFINAVNALLVGAALIATVTFAGWLTPPLGLTAYVPPEPSPASPATSPHYLSLPQPTSVKVFWVSNSLSFFLAIATVLVCAYAAMPSLPHTYIGEAVKSLRKTLIVASTLFLLSVFFVLGAFASAGFAVLPSPHRAYKLSMYSTVAIAKVELLPTKLPPAKSAVGSEDISSREGWKGVVDNDNEQMKNDDETINKATMEKMWNQIVKKRFPEAKDPEEKEFSIIKSDKNPMKLSGLDIQCIINGDQVRDNVVTVYVEHCIPKIPDDTSIAPVGLASYAFGLNQNLKQDRTSEGDIDIYCNVAKDKRYHLFPFLTNRELRSTRTGIEPTSYSSTGHWSLICLEPDRIVHFDSLRKLDKEEVKSFNTVRSKLAKLDLLALEPEEADCPTQKGYTECGYYMMIFLKRYLDSRLKNPSSPVSKIGDITDEDVNKLKNELVQTILRAMDEELK